MNVFSRAPLDLAEQRVPHGRVYLISERCKGCKMCVHFCPRQVLEESSETNAKGYHLPRIAESHEGDCVCCEFCMLICPEFAIFTVEQEA